MSLASAVCGGLGSATWTQHETGTTTNMARRYGRSPSAQRLVPAVPHGHWRTTTLIAALKQSGVIAPLVLDGPMPGPAIRAYVEQFLAPSLEPGDVVVLDNLAAHKVDGVRQAITQAGASILYLPPYSPDLNPIEPLFEGQGAAAHDAQPQSATASVGHDDTSRLVSTAIFESQG